MPLTNRDIALLQAPRASLSREERTAKNRAKRKLRKFRGHGVKPPLTTWNERE